MLIKNGAYVPAVLPFPGQAASHTCPPPPPTVPTGTGGKGSSGNGDSSPHQVCITIPATPNPNLPPDYSGVGGTVRVCAP